MDSLGNPQLRQRTAPAGHGHRTRCRTRALPQHQGRQRRMITREQAQDIFQRAAKLSEADEVEVLIGGASSALTRFANNTIHQNVADENHVVSIRVAFDQRTARASTNKFDNESLKRTVLAAEQMARVQHPDNDLLSLADPKLAPTGKLPQRAFDSTRALGPKERAEVVATIVDVAKR